MRSEVAEALVVIYAAKIVRRDIKPENIFLDDEVVLRTDFSSDGEWNARASF